MQIEKSKVYKKRFLFMIKQDLNDDSVAKMNILNEIQSIQVRIF